MSSSTAMLVGRASRDVVLALVCVTALFFIWAFFTNLIDLLVKSMR